MQCLRKIINQKITDNLATFDSGVFSFLFFHTQSCWSCESKTLEVHLSFVANKTFNKTFKHLSTNIRGRMFRKMSLPLLKRTSTSRLTTKNV